LFNWLNSKPLCSFNRRQELCKSLLVHCSDDAKVVMGNMANLMDALISNKVINQKRFVKSCPDTNKAILMQYKRARVDVNPKSCLEQWGANWWLKWEDKQTTKGGSNQMHPNIKRLWYHGNPGSSGCE